MKLGVVFPQTAIGTDPIAIREYVQAIEDIGYDYLLTYEHVLGANPAYYDDGRHFIYTYEDAFHDPFVLFSWLTGLTKKLEFVSGILILPQRNTAVVAKQSATLSILSGGRFRLGVGVGWNEAEMTGVGYDFSTRGQRIDEQIEVLYRLWTEPLVDYQGNFHDIEQLGLNPRPPEPPPLWFGGTADAVLKRTAKYGDGWIPFATSPQKMIPVVEKMHDFLEAAGRNPAEFGMDVRISPVGDDPEAWGDYIQGWLDLGMTHLCINTAKMDNPLLDENIQLLMRLKQFVDENFGE